jgi:hypothetical protein
LPLLSALVAWLAFVAFVALDAEAAEAALADVLAKLALATVVVAASFVNVLVSGAASLARAFSTLGLICFVELIR